MDSERKSDKQEGESKREISDPLPNALPLLQPRWIRRNIQDGSGLDKFLLEYGINFLPYCGIVSWIVFLLCKG